MTTDRWCAGRTQLWLRRERETLQYPIIPERMRWRSVSSHTRGSEEEKLIFSQDFHNTHYIVLVVFYYLW